MKNNNQYKILLAISLAGLVTGLIFYFYGNKLMKPKDTADKVTEEETAPKPEDYLVIATGPTSSTPGDTPPGTYNPETGLYFDELSGYYFTATGECKEERFNIVTNEKYFIDCE